LAVRVFGSALNPHLHFHCVVLDGVFASAPARGVVFHPATGIDALAIATVQAKVRRRLLSFVRRGLLESDDAHNMAQWAHGGGFSVDESMRIADADHAGRERLQLLCPRCGADLRIIAFITKAVMVRDILIHLGEPITPPPIAPARGPPLWEMQGTRPGAIDPPAQPAPDYPFDQRIAW
jgi:hypothetical protein